jgi:hypothetical protein
MNNNAHWLSVYLSEFRKQSFNSEPSLPRRVNLKDKYFRQTYNFFLYFSIKISDNKSNTDAGGFCPGIGDRLYPKNNKIDFSSPQDLIKGSTHEKPKRK